MQKPKIFQMAIMGIFAVLLILGFLGFSGKLPLPGGSGGKENINYGEVVLWGSLPLQTMQSLISSNFAGEKSVRIKYVEKNAETFSRDFTEALASGNGPDMVILAHDELLVNMNKLVAIPYQTITERDFKDTFITEGDMFLVSEGIVALPFMIDPIVMYWNRDIFANEFLTAPPQFWSEFYNLAPEMTIRDQSGNITRSFVPFGEYRNITNAKEILSVLLMQAGSPIVLNNKGAFEAALITKGPTGAENPVVTAMRFFTEFAKKDKNSYSWNRSLPQSRSMFEAGDLAIYFGYASEYKSIKQKNPHLNFEVAMMPQVSNTATKLTFGRMHGIAIASASKNQQGALHAATLLVSDSVINSISLLTGLPPVVRSLASTRQTDAVSSVFYNSAIISRAWHDPSPSETNSVLMDMIDSVNSNRSNMSDALTTAHRSFERLLLSYRQ